MCNLQIVRLQLLLPAEIRSFQSNPFKAVLWLFRASLTKEESHMVAELSNGDNLTVSRFSKNSIIL